MRNGNAGLRAKPASPFLQVPSFTSDPSIVSRADLLRGLRACLSAMNGFCREKGDPLGVGDIIWPGDRWLSGLSADIQILASKHKRGGNTMDVYQSNRRPLPQSEARQKYRKHW
jgi:hypothetical protein